MHVTTNDHQRTALRPDGTKPTKNIGKDRCLVRTAKRFGAVEQHNGIDVLAAIDEVQASNADSVNVSRMRLQDLPRVVRGDIGSTSVVGCRSSSKGTKGVGASCCDSRIRSGSWWVLPCIRASTCLRNRVQGDVSSISSDSAREDHVRVVRATGGEQ